MRRPQPRRLQDRHTERQLRRYGATPGAAVPDADVLALVADSSDPPRHTIPEEDAVPPRARRVA